jgi:hypothetical protein
MKLHNEDKAILFVAIFIVLGIYEYSVSNPAVLAFEGVFEDSVLEVDTSYFGTIEFNVIANEGKVIALSGVNNVIKELNDCSVFDEENWICRDYYIGEEVGKSRGDWITPNWLRPITWDIEWDYIKYIGHRAESETTPFIFSSTSFDPSPEIYTFTDQSVLKQVAFFEEKIDALWQQIQETEGGIEFASEDLISELLDIHVEKEEVEERFVLEGSQVSRLPLADRQNYGWRINIGAGTSSVRATRTEQTNELNSQLCYLASSPEKYCVFERAAEVVVHSGGPHFLYNSFVTEQSDPQGVYSFSVFVDGMYQGEVSVEFFNPVR